MGFLLLFPRARESPCVGQAGCPPSVHEGSPQRGLGSDGETGSVSARARACQARPRDSASPLTAWAPILAFLVLSEMLHCFPRPPCLDPVAHSHVSAGHHGRVMVFLWPYLAERLNVMFRLCRTLTLNNEQKNTVAALL